LLRVVMFRCFCADVRPRSGRRRHKGFQSRVCFRVCGKKLGGPPPPRPGASGERFRPSGGRPLTPAELTTRGSGLSRASTPPEALCLHADRPTGGEPGERSCSSQRACRASRHGAPGFRGTVDR